VDCEDLPIGTLSQVEQMVNTAQSVDEAVERVMSTQDFVNGRALFLPLPCKESVHFFVGQVSKKDAGAISVISNTLESALQTILGANSIQEARLRIEAEKERLQNDRGLSRRFCTVL
jgi:hypothetical protein